jgi:sulfur carrier protein ThiS
VQDGAVYSGVAIAVTVTLFADFRRLLPRGADGPQRYTVREGATVSELLAAIGVAAGADVTVAVNGELAAGDTPLRDGADVMVLSPMEGGAAGAATTSSPNRDVDVRWLA